MNPIKIELFSVFNLSVLSAPVPAGERKTIMRTAERSEDLTDRLRQKGPLRNTRELLQRDNSLSLSLSLSLFIYLYSLICSLSNPI